MIEINFQPEKKELRVFSMLLMPFALFVAYLIHHYLESPGTAWTVGTLLFLMGLVGSVHPPTVRWLFVGWMVLVFPLGWTISHIVMALVFFGLFLPLGAIARAFGYDPLSLHTTEAASYWEQMETSIDKERYFRQF